MKSAIQLKLLIILLLLFSSLLLFLSLSLLPCHCYLLWSSTVSSRPPRLASCLTIRRPAHIHVAYSSMWPPADPWATFMSQVSSAAPGECPAPAPPQPRQIKPYLAQPEHSTGVKPAVNKRPVINTLTDRLIMMAGTYLLRTSSRYQTLPRGTWNKELQVETKIFVSMRSESI